MGGTEQSDYSRPTDSHVLATGALCAGKKWVIPYKAEHVASKQRGKEQKSPSHPLCEERNSARSCMSPQPRGACPTKGSPSLTPLLYRALQGSKESALGCTSRKKTATSTQMHWTNTKQPQRAPKSPKPIEETPPAHVCETQAPVTPRCAHPRHRRAMRCADPHTERNRNSPIEASLKSFRPSPELM